MEEFEENPFEQDHQNDLIDKFERMIKLGDTAFYEVDDLEYLLEHYLNQNKLELATRVIETAKSQYPHNRSLSIREAELLSLSDRHSEALELLNDIETLEGFNPEFHLTKANILSQTGSYQLAIASLHRALEFTEQDADMIYLNLAIEHQNLEQFNQAIEYLKMAIDVNPDNEDALYELAYCFELTQQYNLGVDFFSKLIDRKPYNAHAWFNLGASHQALEQNDQAIFAFDYTILIDEGFHAAYFNKANVLVKVERYLEAIDLYKKALDFEILDSLIYYYIGDCYENLEDYKMALIYFEKAIKKDDALAEAWVGASNALDFLDREIEALQYAMKAVEIDDQNGDYWCFLASLQQKYDLPDDAIISYEKAIEFGYKEEDLWEEYAELCLSLKLNIVAESAIERGLEYHPQNLLLQLYKCIMLYRNKREEEGFDLLVSILMQDSKLIEEFILHYPKGIELDEIQYLIDSLK